MGDILSLGNQMQPSSLVISIHRRHIMDLSKAWQRQKPKITQGRQTASQVLLKDTNASKTTNSSNQITLAVSMPRKWLQWMRRWPKKLRKQMEALSIRIILATHKDLQTKFRLKMPMDPYTSSKRIRSYFKIWKIAARDSSFREALLLWKWRLGRETRYLHPLMQIRMVFTRGKKFMPAVAP